MTCDEAEDLIGAYALDALPPDEAESFRAHIATCETHAALAAELHAVAARLPALVDPVAPPASLRERVVSAIAQASPATSATATSSQPDERAQWQPASIGRAREDRAQWGAAAKRPPLASPRFAGVWGALAAVLVVGIGALIAWNVVLMNRLDDRGDAQRLASRATASAALATTDGRSVGAVLYFGGEKKAVVIADGIERLDASKTYQMWSVRGGATTSLGTMNADADGHAAAVVPLDEPGAVLAITIEPAGGSDQPTSAAILSAAI